jgi:murein L,D-transpeptidase YcbB/YkuD
VEATVSDFETAIDVLSKNRPEIEKIISQFGIGNIIMAAPSLMRIMSTVAAHKQPVEAAKQAAHVVYYSGQITNSVKSFQEKNGLPADGLIGPATWAKIEEKMK